MRLGTIVLLLASAIGAAPHSVWAADWFVTEGGTGRGTAAAPFGGIQDALDVAQPGDSVHIGPGTYQGSLRSVRNGTDAAPIRLAASGPRGSTIVTAAGRVLTLGHAYQIVEGLVLDGQYGADDLVRVATAAHNLVLRNLEVRRSSRDLIDIGSPHDVLIEGCLIHHGLNPTNGRSDAHGIVAGAIDRLTIRDTEIHTFSGDGVQLDPGRTAPGWNHVTIERARIWLQPLPVAENGFPAGVPPGENAVDTKASGSYPRATIVIRDTVAYGFRDSAFMSNAAAFNLKENIDATLDRVTVYDSQIAFRTRGSNKAEPAGAWVRISNAVVDRVAIAFRYEDNIERLRIVSSTIGAAVGTAFVAGSSTSSGVTTANVLVLGTMPALIRSGPGNLNVPARAFVNAAAGDYHLTTGAAAIDRGVPLAEVTVDRDGLMRPQGAASDVGAYEYQNGVAKAPRK
jgi:hypothetical protein